MSDFSDSHATGFPRQSVQGFSQQPAQGFPQQATRPTAGFPPPSTSLNTPQPVVEQKKPRSKVFAFVSAGVVFILSVVVAIGLNMGAIGVFAAATLALVVCVSVYILSGGLSVSQNTQIPTPHVSVEQLRQLEQLQFSVQQALSSNRTELSQQVSQALSLNRTEINQQVQELAVVINQQLTSVQDGNNSGTQEMRTVLSDALTAIMKQNSEQLDSIQTAVEGRLGKVEGVVDTQLQAGLMQSFEMVQKQLESFSHGLGELQGLAADAKGLKELFLNVKERGTYGEFRLEKLLSDILAPGQYATNVEIADGKRVEFVVTLPGSGDEPLLLPIDSKFPIEDYNRLIDAGTKAEVDAARKALAQKIRALAKDIADKYIAPPKTTDFALMFLPTEGLYAEVIRDAALFEELRDKYKITVVGAATLSAFLGSLQMGFRTLAMEKRSQQVWDTLREVKTAVTKFSDELNKAQKQIGTVDKTLTTLAGARMKALQKALRQVEVSDTTPILDAADEAVVFDEVE